MDNLKHNLPIAKGKMHAARPWQFPEHVFETVMPKDR